MFHLHVDTLESGVKVRVQMIGHNHEIIADSQDFDYNHIMFAQVAPQGSPSDAIAYPFSLVLLFEHEHHKHDMSEPDCPKIEIHFTVEPVNFHVDSITCTDDELKHAKNQDFSRHYTFGRDSQIVEQKLVMPSTWLKEAAGRHPESFLTKGEHGENGKFALIEIELNLQSSGVFSTLVATDFSDLIVSIALFEKDKYGANEPLYIEKNNVLDDMEHKDDRWSQQDKDFNTAHDSQ